MSEYARLEAHYRRLLSVYPPRHRDRYGDEMIDVLMASSTPGQRRPGVRETLDLLVSGLRTRLSAGANIGMSPASRSAATVFGFLTSAVLATLAWYEVTAAVAWGPPFGGWLRQMPYRSVAMGVGWTLVACACLAGLRRIAALGAVLGFLGGAVVVGRGYDSAPNSFVSSWWLLTLTAFAAACFVVVIRPGPPEPRPVTRRGMVALAAAALLAIAEPLVDRSLTVVRPEGGGAWLVHSRIPAVPLPGFLSRYGESHFGGILLVATLVVLVLRLRPAIRRRVLLLAAPTGAAALLIQVGFQGFMESSPQFWPPVYLTAGQWGALVLMPALVFAAGTWLLRRYERLLA